MKKWDIALRLSEIVYSSLKKISKKTSLILKQLRLFHTPEKHYYMSFKNDYLTK